MTRLEVTEIVNARITIVDLIKQKYTLDNHFPSSFQGYRADILLINSDF